MAVRTYDPQDVNVIVNGVVLTGFAEGTFVSIERDEESYTAYVEIGRASCRERRDWSSDVCSSDLWCCGRGNVGRRNPQCDDPRDVEVLRRDEIWQCERMIRKT